jgi:hypothetical protein
LAELRKFATAESLPLINAISASELPLPEIDFEFPGLGGVCGPEPEMAWPEQKIAVLSERQAEDQAVFEAAGWVVFLQPVGEDELLNALRESRATILSIGGDT